MEETTMTTETTTKTSIMPRIVLAGTVALAVISAVLALALPFYSMSMDFFGDIELMSIGAPDMVSAVFGITTTVVEELILLGIPQYLIMIIGGVYLLLIAAAIVALAAQLKNLGNYSRKLAARTSTLNGIVMALSLLLMIMFIVGNGRLSGDGVDGLFSVFSGTIVAFAVAVVAVFINGILVAIHRPEWDTNGGANIAELKIMGMRIGFTVAVTTICFFIIYAMFLVFYDRSMAYNALYGAPENSSELSELYFIVTIAVVIPAGLLSGAIISCFRAMSGADQSARDERKGKKRRYIFRVNVIAIIVGFVFMALPVIGGLFMHLQQEMLELYNPMAYFSPLVATGVIMMLALTIAENVLYKAKSEPYPDEIVKARTYTAIRISMIVILSSTLVALSLAGLLTVL